MAFGDVPADQLAKYGSSLVIEEMGPSAADAQPRRLVLVGPSLPHQGADWGHTNTVVTTWYPGNGDDATQQVLGPRELPSNWEGEWKRTLMGKVPCIYTDENGETNRIASPMVLREVLEAISRGGVLLRVVWAVSGAMIIGSPRGSLTTTRSTQNQDVSIVRIGRIKQFRTPITRHTDVKWNIEFDWKGRGNQSERIANVRLDQDLAYASVGLEASVNASVDELNKRIVSSKKDIRKSASNLTLGQLESIANTPTRLATAYTRKLQANVSNFKRIGNIAQTLRTQPLSVAKTMTDFANNTMAVSNVFLDQMGRRPAELNSTKTRVSSILRANVYLNNQASAAAVNAQRSAELQRVVRQQIVSGGNRGAISVSASSSTRAGDIIAVYIAKSGDTLQRVSMRFYGNPDQGAAILRSNRMPVYTPMLRPGQIVIIPALTNSPAQQTKSV